MPLGRRPALKRLISPEIKVTVVRLEKYTRRVLVLALLPALHLRKQLKLSAKAKVGRTITAVLLVTTLGPAQVFPAVCKAIAKRRPRPLSQPVAVKIIGNWGAMRSLVIR